MKQVIFLVLSLMISWSSFALDTKIGQVRILKGKAYITRDNQTIELQKLSFIDDQDIVKTRDNSLVKISFTDKTNLILGPNSELQIKKFSTKNRRNIFNFVRGKFRAKIQQKVQEGQSVTFQANQVSVGVRGTEFLANSYQINTKSVSDIALLEGKLSTAIVNTEEFTLKAGEAFDTSTYQLKKKIRKIDQDTLKKLLANELELLPEFLKVSDALDKDEDKEDFSDKIQNSPTVSVPSLGVGVGVGMGVLSTPKTLIGADNEAKEKKGVLKIEDKKNLKDEPSDIRDAILRRHELKAENQCFYWFYKRLPGSSEKERFRRERDCDEFEYDL